QVFSARLLSAVCPRTDEPIAAALEVLARHRLVIPDDSGAYFQFTHALVRSVAYDLMLFEQRRTIHRDIAARFESAAFPELAPGPALLFHHWSAAGDDAKTLEYADLAASEALQLGAHRE